uniref:Uncharacterized protein n=1 Tax=Candidatus Kentrum sp. UNK TaxID=2126344 RepID=A0A451B5I2_9GAMM|nr:MAG: hypothetical protein BECKUNK1418G_GA0071005_12243 [Candidatus Kentron sp. UNK]VFK73531.1 MAG: hypothetical protein BECKUNK1418H_GA0071006_12153 [Candidatus Kentron sp. UNK]
MMNMLARRLGGKERTPTRGSATGDCPNRCWGSLFSPQPTCLASRIEENPARTGGSWAKAIARLGRAMEQRPRVTERRSWATKKRPRWIVRPFFAIPRPSDAIDPASRAIAAPTRTFARRPVQLPRYFMQSTGNLRKLHCCLGGLPGASGNCTQVSADCRVRRVIARTCRAVARGGRWSARWLGQLRRVVGGTTGGWDKNRRVR